MRDMHRECHSLRARPSDEELILANGTTRKLDDQVKEARLKALRGNWEEAARALDEAKGYGRPRAAELAVQARRPLGQTYLYSCKSPPALRPGPESDPWPSLTSAVGAGPHCLLAPSAGRTQSGRFCCAM